jgi:exosome complex component RRP4
MSEFLVKEKDIVVPGEVVAKGMDCFPSMGTYREGENIYASNLGLVNISGKVVKIIPLSGVYEPKRGDVVIGQVTDVLLFGWRVNINTTYSAMLSLKDGTQDFVSKGTDLTKYFQLGDYIMASIVNVTSQKLIDLSMKGPGLRKLSGGRMIKVNSHKVPRIIGKHGSMVSMIKNATDCKILVGQNGLIWLNGEPSKEVIAVQAIKMIEDQAHISGLTDKIKSYLEEITGKKIVELPVEEAPEMKGDAQ